MSEERKYYYNNQAGLFTMKELVDLVHQNPHDTHMFWTNGWDDWKNHFDVEEFQGLVPSDEVTQYQYSNSMGKWEYSLNGIEVAKEITLEPEIVHWVRDNKQLEWRIAICLDDINQHIPKTEMNTTRFRKIHNRSLLLQNMGVLPTTIKHAGPHKHYSMFSTSVHLFEKNNPFQMPSKKKIEYFPDARFDLTSYAAVEKYGNILCDDDMLSKLREESIKSNCPFPISDIKLQRIVLGFWTIVMDCCIGAQVGNGKIAKRLQRGRKPNTQSKKWARYTPNISSFCWGNFLTISGIFLENQDGKERRIKRTSKGISITPNLNLITIRSRQSSKFLREAIRVNNPEDFFKEYRHYKEDRLLRNSQYWIDFRNAKGKRKTPIYKVPTYHSASKMRKVSYWIHHLTGIPMAECLYGVQMYNNIIIRQFLRFHRLEIGNLKLEVRTYRMRINLYRSYIEVHGFPIRIFT